MVEKMFEDIRMYNKLESIYVCELDTDILTIVLCVKEKY